MATQFERLYKALRTTEDDITSFRVAEGELGGIKVAFVLNEDDKGKETPVAILLGKKTLKQIEDAFEEREDLLDEVEGPGDEDKDDEDDDDDEESEDDEDDDDDEESEDDEDEPEAKGRRFRS